MKETILGHAVEADKSLVKWELTKKFPELKQISDSTVSNVFGKFLS